MHKKYLVALLPAFTYILLSLYDLILGNNDGIVSGLYFHRLFLRIFLLTGIGWMFFHLSERKNNTLKVLGWNGLFFLGFLFLFEVCAAAYLKMFADSPQLPSYILYYDNPKYAPHLDEKALLWGDLADSVGKWRVPNSNFTQVNCDDSLSFAYETNSLGLRDIEKSRDKPSSVAFIGDSFIEGYMIPKEVRLSDRLEKETGVPHINFGIADANPIAYHLIYKNIAKPNYAHDRVIVGIYQGNDFDSFNRPVNGAFLNSPIYRAFWKEDEITFTLAKRTHSATSLNNEEKNHLRFTRDSLYSIQNISKKLALEFETGTHLSGLIHYLGRKIALKKYNQDYVSYYEKPDWDTPRTSEFVKSIDTMLNEIGDKPTLFLIIPHLKDVINYKKNSQNHFTPYLISRYPSVKIIDLIQVFAEEDHPEKFYIPCDGHWNADGNKLVSDYLITNSIYLGFLNTSE